MKIRPVGIELFHADRHDEADSRFSKFFERAYKLLHTQKFSLHFTDSKACLNYKTSKWCTGSNNWLLRDRTELCREMQSL